MSSCKDRVQLPNQLVVFLHVLYRTQRHVLITVPVPEGTKDYVQTDQTHKRYTVKECTNVSATNTVYSATDKEYSTTTKKEEKK